MASDRSKDPKQERTVDTSKSLRNKVKIMMRKAEYTCEACLCVWKCVQDADMKETK